MADLRNQLFMLLIAFFCVGTISAQLPAYLPANGLLAWYPFNGNANDESGNGNNGVVNGAILAQDRMGNFSQAYSFDGSISYINLGNSFNYNAHTLSCWAKRNSSDGNVLISRISNGPYEFQNSELRVNEYVLGDGENWFSLIGSSGVDPQLWNHYSITYNSSIHEARYYINGQLINVSIIGNYSENVNSPVYVGARPYWSGNNGPSFFFNGSIDDIAIYNRALSAAEVAALYTTSATGTGGGTTSTSTAPPGILYQAEVRNENGEVLANANVNIRFTLHELTANGTVSYQETHALTTNELGLFAATIGAGTAVQGTFASINWAQTTKFLQVEVDAGNGWITMGNQQLMSVPYALYAANTQPGPTGPQGEPGPQGDAGIEGIQGPTGTNGLDGVGIASIQTSGSILIITLTNGQIQTIPFPTAPSSATGSNANTLIYTVNGF